ncbi:TPA: hypothetical protein U8251_000001 [Pseudomonas putida]|nr:hypothetical protein [Pseudomonas putida]
MSGAPLAVFDAAVHILVSEDAKLSRLSVAADITFQLRLSLVPQKTWCGQQLLLSMAEYRAHIGLVIQRAGCLADVAALVLERVVGGDGIGELGPVLLHILHIDWRGDLFAEGVLCLGLHRLGDIVGGETTCS